MKRDPTSAGLQSNRAADSGVQNALDLTLAEIAQDVKHVGFSCEEIRNMSA